MLYIGDNSFHAKKRDAGVVKFTLLVKYIDG